MTGVTTAYLVWVKKNKNAMTVLIKRAKIKSVARSGALTRDGGYKAEYPV